jgi:hypothetical protein
MKEAMIFAVVPPAVMELGSASGFDCSCKPWRIESRSVPCGAHQLLAGRQASCARP